MNASVNHQAAPYMQQAHGQPYPQAPQQAMRAYNVQGDTLVVAKNSYMPDICIVTGQPAQKRVQQKLDYVPGWVNIFYVFSPFVYRLVASIVRKSGELNVAISPAIEERRKRALIIGIAGSIVSCLIMFGGFATDVGILGLVGFVGLIASIIVGTMMYRLVKVVKIDDMYLHLKLPPAALQALAQC